MALVDIGTQSSEPREKRLSPFLHWTIPLAGIMALILIPMAFAARISTEMVLHPSFGPDVFYFYSALSFAGGFHVLLAGLLFTAAAQRFKTMLLNLAVLEMLVGYGVASLIFGGLV